MIRALAFFPSARPSDYGSRLARLRWSRACRTDRVVEWDPGTPARDALSGADAWVVVCEESALPAVAAGGADEPPSGRVLVAGPAFAADPPFVHTLRELEAARLGDHPGSGRSKPAAFAFRTADFPAQGSETIKSLINRLLANGSTHAVDPAFRAVVFPDPSERERPELTKRLPAGPCRILDAGCGAGGAVALAKDRNPGWEVTGIERDQILAERARGRCDRVLEGDLTEILPDLARAGERYDAIVFADVLEHLEDPVAALVAGRRAAAPGGIVLVSVPNVAHLSLVRDLLLGRFDPTGSGLTDVGHLRWFTRSSLAEALGEAGWRSVVIEAEPGAPPPAPEELQALAAAWPDGDREGLMTYQWIAVGKRDE